MPLQIKRGGKRIKMVKNKLERLRALELMCSALIKCIELHRMGIERYDDVLLRISWLNKYIEDLSEEEKE